MIRHLALPGSNLDRLHRLQAELRARAAATTLGVDGTPPTQ
jgi:hypothetical protein